MYICTLISWLQELDFGSCVDIMWPSYYMHPLSSAAKYILSWTITQGFKISRNLIKYQNSIFTWDWHAAKKVDMESCIDCAGGCSLWATGWWTDGDTAIRFGWQPMAGFISMKCPMPIIDIWRCCCIAWGNVIGDLFIRLIIVTCAWSCFMYSITSSSMEALSI